MTEDELVGWHHRLDGRESEQALGVGDGQGSLVCCSHKELDMTERLNCTTVLWQENRPSFPQGTATSPPWNQEPSTGYEAP